MVHELISTQEFIEQMTKGLPTIDVRAPVEFAEGHLPFSVNLPILDNEQRHLVGIEYEQKGNAAAVALGDSLTAPSRDKMTQQWSLALGNPPLLFCWRGGQRSKIAQKWLKDSGIPCSRVVGGYKAIRKNLTQQFSIPPREGLVLCGPTGSGKTKLLRQIQSPHVIDLELLAIHRGSSFGGAFLEPQPRQQTFENWLALRLRQANGKVLLENESRLIGKCVLPTPYFEFTRGFQRIVLRVPNNERIRNIYFEYVKNPAEKFSKEEIFQTLERSLIQIREKLGSERHSKIHREMQEAFGSASFLAEDVHSGWISSLLNWYYDPAYEFAGSKRTGTVQFEGNYLECQAWIQQWTKGTA